MKRLVAGCLVISSILLVSCSHRADSAEPLTSNPALAAEQIAQAEALYDRRADDLNNVRNGLELLRQARINDGANYDAAWKTAKFNYFLGDNTKDEKERDKAFKDGITNGKSAIQLQPDKPDGYFWTGANQGGQARESIFDAAANVNEIRKNMQKVIELQPDYQNATAFVVLAKVELESRGLMGGNAQKAADYLEEALKYEKKNTLIYVNLAEAYLALNRKADARRILDEMRRVPRDERYAAEQSEVDEQARKLESKL